MTDAVGTEAQNSIRDDAGSARGTAVDDSGPPELEHRADRTPDLQRILGLPVVLSVMLADRHMPVESILEITVGTIIEFEVPFDSELPLQIGDRTIGYGQAVKVGERFGLRLSHIHNVHDRIDAMGGP